MRLENCVLGGKKKLKIGRGCGYANSIRLRAGGGVKINKFIKLIRVACGGETASYFLMFFIKKLASFGNLDNNNNLLFIQCSKPISGL